MADRGDPPGDLAKALGHRFAKPELLADALTHPSATKRRGPGPHGYERLEFLGDRVLGVIVAELLWRRFPEADEGELTRRHVSLVRRETLTEVATSLGLGAHLNAAGDDSMRANPGVLADLCEAVIAALYIDGGLEAARRFVERNWGGRLLAAAAQPPSDPKTALQEWAQARGLKLPVYRTVDTQGPSHKRRFTVSVSVQGLPEATASGNSKRAAEVAAAASALAQIEAGGT
ncbi:MAG: ribonuclease III [Stellaceae bacterium]